LVNAKSNFCSASLAAEVGAVATEAIDAAAKAGLDNKSAGLKNLLHPNDATPELNMGTDYFTKSVAAMLRIALRICAWL
jgi:hypothetical protein